MGPRANQLPALASSPGSARSNSSSRRVQLLRDFGRDRRRFGVLHEAMQGALAEEHWTLGCGGQPAKELLRQVAQLRGRRLRARAARGRRSRCERSEAATPARRSSSRLRSDASERCAGPGASIPTTDLPIRARATTRPTPLPHRRPPTSRPRDAPATPPALGGCRCRSYPRRTARSPAAWPGRSVPRRSAEAPAKPSRGLEGVPRARPRAA